MARRDLNAVWTVLESKPPISGIEAAGSGYHVTAGEVLVGVDSDLRRHLLIPLLAGEAARTDTRGRAVHLLRVSHETGQFLSLVCRSSDLETIFTRFAVELLSSVEGVPSPARSAAMAFDRWRELFSDAAQRAVLSEQRLVGLVGELLSLEALLDHGAPRELGYWTGPLGQQHDFRSPSYGLEVKSSLVREGRIVSISSVDQLEAPPTSRLWLVHHRLDRDPGGFNLGDVLERVLAAGCKRQDLASGLRHHGVDLENLRSYGNQRFNLVESRLYDVAQSTFPKITRSSFHGGDIPPGTLMLSYSIDLTNQPPNPLPPSEADRVYSDIGMDASDAVGS